MLKKSTAAEWGWEEQMKGQMNVTQNNLRHAHKCFTSMLKNRYHTCFIRQHTTPWSFPCSTCSTKRIQNKALTSVTGSLKQCLGVTGVCWLLVCLNSILEGLRDRQAGGSRPFLDVDVKAVADCEFPRDTSLNKERCFDRKSPKLVEAELNNERKELFG